MKKLLIFLFLTLPGISLAALNWQHLDGKIDYLKFTPSSFNPWSHIHVFKFSLRDHKLFMALASDDGDKGSTVKQLANKYRAIIAINGGFFNPQSVPIGLRIQAGKIKSRLKNISWWAVFYTANGRATITPQTRFKARKNIHFAVQGGPRLIIQGRIPSLKGGRAERSAVCITKSGEILLLATEHAAVTTTELAGWMLRPEKDDGLGCYDALNLDGGGSTQVFAHIGDFYLHSPGFSRISDAILVLPRS